MDTSKLTALAIAGGIVFAAYKYGNSAVKTAAIGVAGVLVAKQIPYVRDMLA